MKSFTHVAVWLGAGVVLSGVLLGLTFVEPDDSERDEAPRALSVHPASLDALGGPSRMDGGYLSGLPASREMLGAASPATDDIPTGVPEDVLPWEQARLEMRADFVPSRGTVRRFRQSMLTLLHNAGQFSHITEKLVVSADASPDWDAIWEVDEGAELSELQKQDMTTLVRDAAPSLVEAAAHAEDLLQHALLEYWESDRGFKYLESQGSAAPEGFFNPKGGSYSLCFEAIAGGWKIAVNFDSEDYLYLEDQLRESHRQRVELYNALVTVANSR